MTSDLTLKETQKEWHGSLKAYLMGFIAAFILTALSFSLVISKLLSGHFLVYSLIALAILQAIVQLLLFLHVGQEDKPRWETIAFCFTVMVVLIIVIGTLWVMNDLNERTMSGMNKERIHD